MGIDFIRGVKLGLEYVDLDDSDRAQFDNDATMMIVLDLFVARFVFFTGHAE